MRAVAARLLLFCPEKLWQKTSPVTSLARDGGMT
jgi:hypothetical protein